ncbi:hypothetical protein PCL_08115 [Purpureocillium lilacinum]|uniref:TM7S3/TM198-like domain-containing protein n=1 Tax=Purpureocillium lilacinum TaxID=33203 RepID=A0A2U3EJX8_PURLI|nr:hypothetical protein PCL_08115 [Purpureocillium lilacinum]
MFAKVVRVWAILSLVLALQLAAAQSFQVVVRRQDGDRTASPSMLGDVSASPSSSGIGSSTMRTDDAGTASITSPPSGTERPSALPTSTIISTKGPLDNSTFLNATIPVGQLPLPPQITPGWGVAGVIMLITGVTYTLVGIKNRWIHTFFSTAYITALGVAVLIVYVMNIPVSNAIQGGYVVAVIMSGCAVGAASMFFKELTEGLGCALGGFCVSMWLLCLVPGGLLQSVPSKAIFIAVFTLVGFGFYFSRWTRDWALIGMISFAGATVTVLGIDCYSRAGLKEFWVYIWQINGNLFPLGADTYPVTKGIRVETAAIVIIALVGIISQIKLWIIVREKREKRAAERAEDQRNLEVEEENVGRQVEETNARERRRWERVHGEGTIGSGESRTSDYGDYGSEKRLRGSHNGSYKPRSSAEVYEMADISESEESRSGPNALMEAEEAQDGKVTVRVAADDIPESHTDIGDDMDAKTATMSEGAAISGTGAKRLSQRTATSKRISQAQTVTEAPEVVPLPFTVPENNDAESNCDRSSVATFADEVEDEAPMRRQVERPSLANRLSQGSATLLRSLSSGARRGQTVANPEHGESCHELVQEPTPDEGDDESLAATVDNDSVSGADRQSIYSEHTRKSVEINADLSKEDTEVAAHDNSKDLPKYSATAALSPQVEEGTEERPEDARAGKDNSGVVNAPQDATNDSPANSELPSQGIAGESAAQSQAVSAVDPVPEPSEKQKSVATSVASTPASLTQDRLPRPLSRVAMSYRTNEWVKHLSYADTPELDDLQVNDAGRPTKTVAKERSVPVDVEELQKTATEGIAPAALKQSEPQVSIISHAPSGSKRASRHEHAMAAQASYHPQDNEIIRNATSPPPLTASSPPPPVGISLSRSTSSMALRKVSPGFDPIVEEQQVEPPNAEPRHEEASRSSTVSRSPSLAGTEAPQRAAVPGVVSYASPQTLIGQRELFLRSKSQASLLAQSPEPTFAAHGPGSDGGSIYNYPVHASQLNVADPDDLPLSQRREIMRQSSLMSLSQPNNSVHRLSHVGHESAESLPFNSHQPRRSSALLTRSARDSQLASFRQSVQQDLRSGTPIMATSGRESPFTSSSLLGNREAEVQRNIEMQRNVLMGQKEAEAQRREMQRREKEHLDRAFDERMRNGDLLEVHREAMRKMQKGAR